MLILPYPPNFWARSPSFSDKRVEFYTLFRSLTLSVPTSFSNWLPSWQCSASRRSSAYPVLRGTLWTQRSTRSSLSNGKRERMRFQGHRPGWQFGQKRRCIESTRASGPSAYRERWTRGGTGEASASTTGRRHLRRHAAGLSCVKV